MTLKNSASYVHELAIYIHCSIPFSIPSFHSVVSFHCSIPSFIPYSSQAIRDTLKSLASMSHNCWHNCLITYWLADHATPTHMWESHQTLFVWGSGSIRQVAYSLCTIKHLIQGLHYKKSHWSLKFVDRPLNCAHNCETIFKSKAMYVSKQLDGECSSKHYPMNSNHLWNCSTCCQIAINKPVSPQWQQYGQVFITKLHITK